MVLANIAIFAPSLAQAFAIAKPIPLEPPVTTIVLFLNGLSVEPAIWFPICYSLFMFKGYFYKDYDVMEI